MKKKKVTVVRLSEEAGGLGGVDSDDCWVVMQWLGSSLCSHMAAHAHTDDETQTVYLRSLCFLLPPHSCFAVPASSHFQLSIYMHQHKIKHHIASFTYIYKHSKIPDTVIYGEWWQSQTFARRSWLLLCKSISCIVNIMYTITPWNIYILLHAGI